MMASDVKKTQVLTIAFFSRVAVIVLQVLSNVAFNDHEADAFRTPKPRPQNDLEKYFYLTLEGLGRWDGQHFLNIAEFGYIFEKSLAFFPLLPLLMYIIGNSVFWPLQLVFHYHTVLLLSAVTLNLMLFPLAALFLYELSKKVFGDPARAYKASVMFCFNPASIFFSAVYSETLFCCLVFAGLYHYQKRSYGLATLLLAAATCARSNGTLNTGFFLYHVIVCLPFITHSKFQWKKWIAFFFTRILQILIIFLPFVLFQLYSYNVFCNSPFQQLSKSIQRLSIENPEEYLVRGQETQWCTASLPFPYAYIQKRYWNVGFLNYYQLKQIPNFLLAMPVVVLCFHGIFGFAYKVLKTSSIKLSHYNIEIFPYIVHCCFLVVFGLTSLHVQVLTRLLASSTPTLYWFAANLLCDNKEKEPTEHKRSSHHSSPLSYYEVWRTLPLGDKAAWAFFLSYFLIGIFAFSNSLPWT